MTEAMRASGRDAKAAVRSAPSQGPGPRIRPESRPGRTASPDAEVSEVTGGRAELLTREPGIPRGAGSCCCVKKGENYQEGKWAFSSLLRTRRSSEGLGETPWCPGPCWRPDQDFGRSGWMGHTCGEDGPPRGQAPEPRHRELQVPEAPASRDGTSARPGSQAPSVGFSPRMYGARHS